MVEMIVQKAARAQTCKGMRLLKWIPIMFLLPLSNCSPSEQKDIIPLSDVRYVCIDDLSIIHFMVGQGLRKTSVDQGPRHSMRNKLPKI